MEYKNFIFMGEITKLKGFVSRRKQYDVMVRRSMVCDKRRRWTTNTRSGYVYVCPNKMTVQQIERWIYAICITWLHVDWHRWCSFICHSPIFGHVNESTDPIGKWNTNFFQVFVCENARWVSRTKGKKKKKWGDNGRAIECVNLAKMSVGWTRGKTQKKHTAVNEYYITIITEMIIIYLDWM